MNDTLQHKITHLPVQPGVYLMRDAARTVIYVGKAKVLRNRVRTYFGDISDAHPRTQAMVSQVVDFDIIVVGSEMEALGAGSHAHQAVQAASTTCCCATIRATRTSRSPCATPSRRSPWCAGRTSSTMARAISARIPNVSAMWDMVRLVRRVFKLRQETKNSPRRRAGCAWDEHERAAQTAMPGL